MGIGKVMLEFEILARGLYRPDQLDITYNPSLRMHTSPAIQEYVTTREPEFARGRARQELGNALSVCSVVETDDGYILLDKRQGVDVYEGRYNAIGGFFERDPDMVAT